MLKKLVYKIVPKAYARLPLSADDRVIEQLVVGNQMLTVEKQENGTACATSLSTIFSFLYLFVGIHLLNYCHLVMLFHHNIILTTLLETSSGVRAH